MESPQEMLSENLLVEEQMTPLSCSHHSPMTWEAGLLSLFCQEGNRGTEWASRLFRAYSNSGVETGVMLKALDFQVSVHHPIRGWMRPWRKPAGSSAAEHKGLGLSPPPRVKAGASMLIKMSLPSSPCWVQLSD